jgi:beta-lactamase class A
MGRRIMRRRIVGGRTMGNGRTGRVPASVGHWPLGLLAVVLAGVGGALPLAAQGPGSAPGAQAPTPVEHQELLRAQLVERIEGRLSTVDGVVGLWVRDLTDGWSWGRNADGVFPTASAIKIAILAEMGRQAAAGRISLQDPVRLGAADHTGGSGILQHMGDGTLELSLRDLSVFMIQMSDNTATNVLIDRVGMEAVNSFLDGIGLSETRLRRKMIRPADQAAGRENVSTPRELGRLVEMLHAGELASPEGTMEMLEVMAIPKGGTIPSGLPAGVRVSHKTGTLGGVIVDAGVVLLEGRPYVVSVMATLLGDSRAAGATLSEVVGIIHDHMARLERANSFGAALPRGFSRDR